MSRGSRMRRVNEMLREAVAEEVRILKDPRIGFVTITAVDTAPDLRSAVVYYSVLGEPEEQEATAEALAHAAPHVQQGVGGRIRLKYLPKLRFSHDDALEAGLRINELLHELEETRGTEDQTSD